MLAMADRKGRVWASLPGLANRARVSLEEAEAAIHKFMSPDKYSRTSDFEGRRIEVIDGGWRLLNHEKYRSIRDEEVVRESKRKYINTRRAVERDVENVDRSRHNAEAEAEAKNKTTLSGLPPDAHAPRKKNNTHNATARSLLAFLNEKTGRNYQPVKVNLDMISARLKEGATERQCRLVILRKFHDWGTDEKMQEYLRPATLFNRTKFAQYIGEIPREESHG